MTLERDDNAAPTRAPGTRAWRVYDDAGRFCGVVAGSGRVWTSGRVGPLRSAPFVDMAYATSRTAAAMRLVTA